MKELVAQEVIENKIQVIRGKKVMLDRDLAGLYEVETKVFNQAVKRNIERFPEDFMFQLLPAEKNELVTNCDRFASWKHSSVLPYAFTEYGVAMLSSVLNSQRAIEINIQIIRAFIRLRTLVAENKDLLKMIRNIEKRLDVHDQQIKIAFAALKSILQPEPETPPQLPAKEYSPGKEKKMGFGKASGKR
ncbi:MAG: ORF6N domain-containing protein [Chitinispirillaceae bacterium]|jgi:hypothetical protein